MGKKIEKVKTGYIAITAEGKMLKNYWSGGSQTGRNAQSLTDDITAVSIGTKEEIEMYIIWFNNTHKNKVNFEIKSVVRKDTITLDIE